MSGKQLLAIWRECLTVFRAGGHFQLSMIHIPRQLSGRQPPASSAADFEAGE